METLRYKYPCLELHHTNHRHAHTGIITWERGRLALEREATGLLVLVEARGVDSVEGPDEAEDTQEDPPQQVVAQAEAQPGALRGHPVVHERQRRRRGRGHRARRREQGRAGAAHAGGRGRLLGVLGVAAPHPLAPRPQLWQP